MLRISIKSADCNRNNKKNGWTHHIKRGSIAIIFSLAMMTLSGCSLYDIATIAFTLIKKRAIRIFFIGFEDDGKLAKSFTYNAFNEVIIPLEFVILAYLMAMVIGLAIGFVNAVLIAKLNIPPLIATLGVSSVVNGGTLAFLGTQELSNIPDGIDALSKIFIYTYENAQGIKYQLTVMILIPIVLIVVVWYILKHTMLGRGIYAIGGDKNAARIAGFNVTKIQFIIYMASGAFAGVGGLTYMVLLRHASPQAVMGSEMMVIAAVVMGGTRITGGHGTMAGTVFGVILIALVQNNLVMLGVPTHFQTFVVGLIIVIGTSITSLRAKKIANSAKV